MIQENHLSTKASFFDFQKAYRKYVEINFTVSQKILIGNYLTNGRRANSTLANRKQCFLYESIVLLIASNITIIR